MGCLDDFLNDNEKRMHEELHEWCDSNMGWEGCDVNCPFHTADGEKDPSKMHWCHVDYVETSTDKPHPAFLDALYRDYGYLKSQLIKPCEGKGVEPVNVDLITEKLTEGINKFVKEKNAVEHPEHYNQGGIECIDALIAAFGKEAVSHFCICNLREGDYINQT